MGFVALLKFFEIEGRFPQYAVEVPEQAVGYLAEQVKAEAGVFAKYDFSSRAAKYHRVQIQEALGFRECSEADQEELAGWLVGELRKVTSKVGIPFRIAEAAVGRPDGLGGVREAQPTGNGRRWRLCGCGFPGGRGRGRGCDPRPGSSATSPA